MKGFAWWRRPVRASSLETSGDSDESPSGGGPTNGVQAEEVAVAGERTTAAVARPPSLQSRVTGTLAASLLAAMTLGLIGWYYVHSFATGSRGASRTAAANKDKGEMLLPPLGRVDPPSLTSQAATAVLGPPPEIPNNLVDVPDNGWSFKAPPHDAGIPHPYGADAQTRPTAAGPADAALARKLSADVFARATGGLSERAGTGRPVSRGREPPLGDSLVADTEAGTAGRTRDAGDLDGLLSPTATPAVLANVLPTQTLLLPKGAFLDCTLETAIDSTLPGMTTCVTATDTFGADGRVVLLERGTKLVGETRGQVRHGSPRIFVLWTEARTPTGVVVPLASPGTDELGRSGLSGDVDRHFIERFGAAILISVIDGAVQAMVQAQQGRGNSTVIVSPSTSRDIMTEILRSTVDIPPTVVKPQGDRIQVLVARDLDFRSVYELRPVARR